MNRLTLFVSFATAQLRNLRATQLETKFWKSNLGEERRNKARICDEPGCGNMGLKKFSVLRGMQSVAAKPQRGITSLCLW